MKKVISYCRLIIVFLYFMRSWFYWCFWYWNQWLSVVLKKYIFHPLCYILEVFTVLFNSFSPVSSFPAFKLHREENNYQKEGTCKLGIERRKFWSVTCGQSFYHNFACVWALAQCLEWKSSSFIGCKQFLVSNMLGDSHRYQQKMSIKKVALQARASINSRKQEINLEHQCAA